MIILNLTTKSTEQELIKKYLEENASETLADKINNGVRIEKDGKTLINKKTLEGFMKYAAGEARKQAEKGASAACVRSDVVFALFAQPYVWGNAGERRKICQTCRRRTHQCSDEKTG